MDARCRGRLADDAARALTADGLAGAGGQHPSPVSARSSRGRPGRRPGPATHLARHSGVAVPDGGVARCADGHRRGPTMDARRDHARHRRGKRNRHPSVAGDDSRGRAAGGAARERGTGNRRDQHRPRRRTGNRRRDHCRRRTGAGVPHQCRVGAGRLLRSVAVAARVAPCHAARRASGVRRARRPAVCPLHAGAPVGHRPDGRFRAVRQRALGAPPARREDIVRTRPHRVRCPRWMPRPGRTARRRALTHLAEAPVDGRDHGARDRAVRIRMSRAGVGNALRHAARRDGHRRRRMAHNGVDPDSGGAARGGPVGTGPRARGIHADAVRVFRDWRVAVGSRRQRARHQIGAHGGRRWPAAGTRPDASLPPGRH